MVVSDVIILCWTIHLYEVLSKSQRIFSFICHTTSAEAHLSNNFLFYVWISGLLSHKLSTIFSALSKILKYLDFLSTGNVKFQASPITVGDHRAVVEIKRTTTRGKP